MKLWLDDERPVPDGWVGAKTAHEAITLLKTGLVEILSFDHDLGPAAAGTGYDVVCWLEEHVANNTGFDPPRVMLVHSANPVGAQKIRDGIRSIMRLLSLRHEGSIGQGNEEQCAYRC